MSRAAVIITILAVLLGIFLYYPVPPLTETLQKYQKTGEYVQINDNNIFAVDVKGEGPSGSESLICLHGFPSSSYDWIKTELQMSRQFKRVIYFDFLGFGFSDKPIDYNYTISEQADITIFLLSHFNITRVHVLSHDYGDTVALEILARYNSNKLDSRLELLTLTMLNGGIFQETHQPRLLQKLLLVPVIGPIAARLTFYQIFQKGFNEVFGEVKPDSDEMWSFWVSLRYSDGTLALPRIIHFLNERRTFSKRYVGALKQSVIPVHMIYGPADPVNPSPAFAQKFRKEVPQHKLSILHNAVGHYPQWEAPEVFFTAFQQFIKSYQQ